MAFTSGLGDRADDLRFRNPQSPRDESPFPNLLTSPLRSIGSAIQPHAPLSSDPRATLHRRFTTNTVPTFGTQLSPIGQQRRQAAESTDFSTTATFHKVQLLEKKKQEFEYLREQRLRFQAEMELLEMQSKRGAEEIHRLSSDLSRLSTGPQSEPTTPPEYHATGLSSIFGPSRSHRFSSASMVSPPPPGLITRPGRSGSQITSPPGFTIGHNPSKSVPGSRRGSDEDEAPADFEVSSANRRSAVKSNRMSMPVGLDLRAPKTGYLDTGVDIADILGHIDTSKFTYDDEDHMPVQQNVKSPDAKKYTMQLADGFPTLREHTADGTQLSASSAALDLARSSSPSGDTQTNGWGSFARHRQAQHSLPTNTFSHAFQSPEAAKANGSSVETTPKSTSGNRRSMEVNFSAYNGFGESKRSSVQLTPPNGSTNGMPKLQASYSTNDIPTLKNANGMNGGQSTVVNSHAEQHLHNHNASLGRIPPNAINKRHSRELSGGDARAEDQATRPGIQSVLHANATPFGPTLTSPSASGLSTTAGTNGTIAATTSAAPTAATTTVNSPIAYYAGYGMPMLNMTNVQNMNPMQLGQWGAAPPSFYQQPFGGPQYAPSTYQPQPPYAGSRFPVDSQARVIQSRRLQNGDADNRFANFDVKLHRDEIYSLCKDQHGCRFLQKKLEERNPELLQIIFEQTNGYVVELMTDPFGNYLCQKLLEFTTDNQRTVLINNAAPQMVKIALNQHGTRALQKMIEFVSTREQIQTIIHALKDHVITLIQDLNGNHVIQKCLNHLKSEDAQFIYDAVGMACVTVGTHRHGCCVLQRCIDHASREQRSYLVGKITENSVMLVQDPFGNYVVQYILDLNEAAFTRPLCQGFGGKVCDLSRQKFSSNVIEKCIRVADVDMKRLLITELLHPTELEKLLRDSYANYVMQTALDYAPNDICVLLIEAIRPIIPTIRQTPYGRRIQTKIQERESRLGLTEIGMAPMAPVSYQSPEVSYTAMANGYAADIASPQPHRLSNPPLPSQLQNTVQEQGFASFNRGAQTNGLSGFF